MVGINWLWGASDSAKAGCLSHMWVMRLQVPGNEVYLWRLDFTFLLSGVPFTADQANGWDVIQRAHFMVK